jgi:hypothetical protein
MKVAAADKTAASLQAEPARLDLDEGVGADSAAAGFSGTGRLGACRYKGVIVA